MWTFTRIRPQILATCLIVSVTACLDDSAPTGTVPATAAAVTLIAGLPPVTNPDGRPETLDEMFARIAESAPGFGGLYYDDSDGRASAYFVDTLMAHDVALRRLLVAVFNQNPKSVGASPITEFRTLPGRFDWRDLKRWRHLINGRIAAIAGLVGTDIEERWNRIAVEVDNQGAQAEARSLIGSLAVPLEAVVVRVTSPNVDFDNLATTRFSLVPGGVKVVTDGGRSCTFGFNAQLSVGRGDGSGGVYDSRTYWVTAAHCVNQMGFATNTQFYQPSTGSTNRIGVEWRQPMWNTTVNDTCPGAQGCSLADAVLVLWFGERFWEFGKIARSEGFPAFGSNPGTLEVSSFDPRMRIADSTDSRHTSVFGQSRYKVGSGTGWTGGTITVTCYDRPSATNPSLWLLCQDGVNAHASFGDSGGPVVLEDAGFTQGAVTLAGILQGGREGDPAFFYMSQFTYLRWELTKADFAAQCQTGQAWPCWTGLTVTTPF